MLMPASTEFVELCRAQVTLLIRSLGAISSAVYLSEEFPDQRRELIPIVVYPDAAVERTLTLPGESAVQSDTAPAAPRQLSAYPTLGSTSGPKTAGPETANSQSSVLNQELVVATSASGKPERLVLPLIHAELVLGLLVIAREGQPWTTWEQEQVAEVAHTLAIACVLDQRHQWTLQADYQQRSLLARQHETLANLLHQFRNPLTTLRTLAKLLQKRLLPGDPQRELAGSILQESERLQKLLEQFDQTLDAGEAVLEHPPGQDAAPLSLPAANPLPLPPASITGTVGETLHLQPCWLVEVLAPLLRSAQAVAEERQLTLVASLPEEIPPVLADPTALQEVFSNLLDNALKYTPAGGEVWVELRRQAGQQVVLFGDTGPGIPEQDQPRLFERHYRGVQAQGSIPGTGLGLAIARELVIQMGGKLELVSPEATPGNASGSRFRITIPELGSELDRFNNELQD